MPNRRKYPAIPEPRPGDVASLTASVKAIKQILDSLIGVSGNSNDVAITPASLPALIAALGGVGTDGIPGSSGEPGPPGSDGDDGAAGPPGPAGAAGAAGATGADGLPSGVVTMLGLPGQDGDDGAPGVPGAPGSRGSIWRMGVGAPALGSGVDGDFYFDVSAGDVYSNTGGVFAVVGNMKGAPGPTGASWTAGYGAPDDSVGADNDFYLDYQNGNVWQRISGTYIYTANLAGTASGGTPVGLYLILSVAGG